jgi:hypothetical protein
VSEWEQWEKWEKRENYFASAGLFKRKEHCEKSIANLA